MKSKRVKAQVNKPKHHINSDLFFYQELFEDLLLDIAEHVKHEIEESLTRGLDPATPQYNWAAAWASSRGYVIDDLVKADLRFIRKSVKDNGINFFTKILPSFGRAIDKALSSDLRLDAPSFLRRKHGVLPAFLSWLTNRVFDDEGLLLGISKQHLIVNAEDVLRLRQLTYAYYKLEQTFTKQQEAKAISAYLENERSLEGISIPDDDRAIEHASNLIARVCAKVNAVDIIPRHGPGAVATGEQVWEKNGFRRLYPQLEQKYPFTEYFTSCLAEVCDEYHNYGNLEIVMEPTAKVVFVPKDSRGPRTISCEPVELQWIQQGIARNLVNEIEQHPLTKGHVNFRDQMVNRTLAKWGSLGANWVTLDMKDASDLVSLQLVQRLFSKTHLLDYMLAARSTHNLLPDGTVIKLRKFAPMGSALCFPTEALVFWALAVGRVLADVDYLSPVAGFKINSAIGERGQVWATQVNLRSLDVHNSRKLTRAIQSIYVYGDDIICQREDYARLVEQFESVGLKVNAAKCCTGRFFRESCGLDAFNGKSVTPIKFRTPLCPIK